MAGLFLQNASARNDTRPWTDHHRGCILLPQMDIDRPSRRCYAEALRHFAAGRLTNREYEAASEKLLNSRDAAPRQIWLSVWFCYDDFRTHRLSGKWGLTEEGRRTIARAIVFLHSDLPYEWPPTPLLRMLLGLLTFGIGPRLFPQKPSAGDDTVWPFFRPADFTDAKSRPWLLAGANQPA